MISFKQLSEKASAINSKINWKTWIWIGLGLAALPALRIFYVQEMLAALIGFSILFAVIYITVFAIFLLVRGSKPVVAWTKPKVGAVLHWSAETAESAVANPAWTKATPLWAKTVPVWAKALTGLTRAVPRRVRSQQLKLNENYKTVHSRFARLGPWAMPKVRHVARRTVETASGVAQSVITSPAWAKATPLWTKTVPVWVKAVPHRLRGQQLRLNENCKTAYSQFARLGIRPSYVYRISLQKGGAALTMGLRTHKRIANQVGNWLTKRVTHADLIRLRSISRVESLLSRTQARRP